MSGYSFSTEPPEDWDRHCTRHNALFHSTAWQALLEQAFKCQTVYGWNSGAKSGLAITNFKAGPFRIGYVGFPVGGLIGEQKLSKEMIRNWSETRLQHFTHCLKIPASDFDNPTALAFPYQSNPETAIPDLQAWDWHSVSKKLRRDVKKAQRSEIEIRNANDPSVGHAIHTMYSDTVRRHGGALRYNRKYFQGLITLAASHPHLQCFVAWLEETIAGFVIVGRHGDTAYYLHGGTNFELRQYSPSDLLLLEAIIWAKDKGGRRFNLMSSSIKQPSLIKYKEKWGGVTRENRTYTLSLNSFICGPFALTERLFRVLRRQ